ncbi:MAG: 1,2-phenylacetyl-CoA epoxidase subunit PaaD [Granulosicoccus sp.]
MNVSTASENPSTDQIWTWLHDVPDPEIPVISVVDLGIVRKIVWEQDTLVVHVTPTYSGCPATAVINADIESRLRKEGIESIRLERQLSPAWNTAWISKNGREKLLSYGIAPPVEGTGACGLARPQITVCCPRCRSTNTERISQFGSTPCKAAYRCKACLEPFDYFKCI